MGVYHNSFNIPDNATLASFDFEDYGRVTELPKPISSRLVGIIMSALRDPLKYRKSSFEALVHFNDGFLPGNIGDGSFSVSIDGVVEGEEIHSYTVENTSNQDYRAYAYDLHKIPIKHGGETHIFTGPDGWIFRAVYSSLEPMSGKIIQTLVYGATSIEWAPSFSVEDIQFFKRLLVTISPDEDDGSDHL